MLLASVFALVIDHYGNTTRFSLHVFPRLTLPYFNTFSPYNVCPPTLRPVFGRVTRGIHSHVFVFVQLSTGFEIAVKVWEFTKWP